MSDPVIVSPANSDVSTAAHQELQPADSVTVDSTNLYDNSSSNVILVFNYIYLRSRDFLLRILQMICALVCLILVVCCTSRRGDYLTLPFATHLQFIVFTCVFAMLLCLMTISLRITGTLIIFSINWNMFDMVVYGATSVLFLCATIVTICDTAAVNTDSYETVCSAVCAVIHCLTAVYGVKRWRKTTDSKSQRILLSQQISVSTETTETNPHV